MKKFIYIAALFVLFGGCTTKKHILKTESNLKIEKDIESNQTFVNKVETINTGKSAVTESSTVEEMSIKKPASVIELTANFKIDSAATLRGDTALKLVDVSDKNVSITIYQNGKTNELTAKIKSKHSTEDVPFSEIKIRKATTVKTAEVDTTKTLTSEVSGSSTVRDKFKVVQSDNKVEKDVTKVNYLGLVGMLVIAGLLIWWINKS